MSDFPRKKEDAKPNVPPKQKAWAFQMTLRRKHGAYVIVGDQE